MQIVRSVFNLIHFEIYKENEAPDSGNGCRIGFYYTVIKYIFVFLAVSSASFDFKVCGNANIKKEKTLSMSIRDIRHIRYINTQNLIADFKSF